MTEDVRTATRAWLSERLGDVPDRLAEAVEDLLERASRPEERPEGVRPAGDTVPDFLAYAAVCELDRVAREEQDRELAVRLLAADACLTWAFEAAADRGEGEALDELAEANGLRGRIGDLLERIGAEA